MATTLFTFTGFHLLCSEKCCIVGSREQFEAFNHLWRVLGHLLGIEERFNLCGATLKETLGRLKAVQKDILLPALQFEDPEFNSYARII